MHLKKGDAACWFVAKTHGMIGILKHSLERWCLGLSLTFGSNIPDLLKVVDKLYQPGSTLKALENVLKIANMCYLLLFCHINNTALNQLKAVEFNYHSIKICRKKNWYLIIGNILHLGNIKQCHMIRLKSFIICPFGGQEIFVSSVKQFLNSFVEIMLLFFQDLVNRMLVVICFCVFFFSVILVK